MDHSCFVCLSISYFYTCIHIYDLPIVRARYHVYMYIRVVNLSMYEISLARNSPPAMISIVFIYLFIIIIIFYFLLLFIFLFIYFILFFFSLPLPVLLLPLYVHGSECTLSLSELWPRSLLLFFFSFFWWLPLCITVKCYSQCYGAS